MRVLFPQSGVETHLLLPPAVSLVISFFTSMSGISGAFLLLPFQMSVLGFVSPAVSATNLVFNLVAIPAGVYRYVHERRMVWPLTLVVVGGSIPGVVVGGLVRLHWLPDPGPFKAFVGVVLFYIGARLLWDNVRASGDGSSNRPQSKGFEPGSFAAVDVVRFTWRDLVYRFAGAEHACGVPGIFGLSLAVGLVGGIYGIGGGAIIAPYFVAIYKLPIYTVAGATLMGTFATSIFGVAFYEVMDLATAGMRVAADWALGALFGAGGVLGMYLGARTQRHVPARWIKLLIATLILFVAVRYVLGYVARWVG